MAHVIGKRYLKIAGFVFLLLVIWEGITMVFNIHPILLPAPSRIVNFIVENASFLLHHTGVTTYAALVGLALGISIGLALGIIIGISKIFRDMSLPLLITADVTPKVALAPLLLIIFGFGIVPKIVLVILITFFPVVINTAEGIKSVQPDLLDLAHSLKAGGWKIFSKIRLPNALPYMFAGIRIAVPLSFVGAVIAEFAGGSEGIGWVLIDAIWRFRMDQTIAGIIFVGVVGVTMFYALSMMERKAMPWHKEKRTVTGVY